MGLFSGTTLKSLRDLYIQQLQDVYNAEKRLIDALPLMADAAATPELKDAFRDHLQQTRQHKERLEMIFESMGQPAEGEPCAAMKGLIHEGNDMINAKGNDLVRDAGLIAAAQRVEYYEIAAYGCVKTYAERLGFAQHAQLLNQTLEEEKQTDDKLTTIAENTVNLCAQMTSADVNHDATSRGEGTLSQAANAIGNVARSITG